MDITPIGPADWDTFRAVRLASLSESPEAFGSRYADWVDAPAERWRARLTQVPLNLVAREGTEVVGVVSGQLVDEDRVELISMWVAPAARGTGAAGRLIDRVVAWAADQGRATFLMVRTDNARARKAYERAGFVDVGVPEGWAADEPPEHLMERRSSLPTLTTERLVLRPVTVDDLPLMVELNADPAVMALVRGRAATAEETADEWRRRLERQSDPSRGLGYWAGLEGPAFVGWWSASSFDGRPEVSGVGYRLIAAAWGRGLATEGARAMVDQAFARPEIDRVLASTMAANTGSRRVLEKVGMAHTASWAARGRNEVSGRQDGEVGYELTRAAWAAAH